MFDLSEGLKVFSGGFNPATVLKSCMVRYPSECVILPAPGKNEDNLWQFYSYFQNLT